MSTTSPHEGALIGVDRYAEVLAHIRYFPADKHAEVIARMGIRRRDWDAAAAKWKGVRDAERMSGKLDVTVRFGRVMTDTRAKLEARQPTLESLGPFPGPDGIPVQAAAPAARPGAKADPANEPADAAPATATAVQVPTYVAAQLFSVAPMMGPAPPVYRAPSELAGTLPLGTELPTGAALPFTAPVVSAAESIRQAAVNAQAAQGPANASRNRVGSGTVADGAALPLPGRVADPRAPKVVSTLDVHLGLAPASPFDPITGRGRPQPQLPRGPAEFGGTSLDVQLGLAPALPFDASKGPAQPQPQVLRGPAEVHPSPVGSGTVGVGDASAAPQRPPGVVELTVEQYASLRAEVMVRPDVRPATLSRYGVSQEGYDALVAYWDARFAADTVLSMTFVGAYTTYLTWLKANPGR